MMFGPPSLFMGKPFEYWRDLDFRVEKLIAEIDAWKLAALNDDWSGLTFVEGQWQYKGTAPAAREERS